MAAFNGVKLAHQQAGLLTAPAPTAAAWTPQAHDGVRIGHLRVKVWNGTAWVDAPPS